MDSVYKLPLVLKYDKGNSYFTLRPIPVYDYIWLNHFYNFKFPDRICGRIQNIIYIHQPLSC